MNAMPVARARRAASSPFRSTSARLGKREAVAHGEETSWTRSHRAVSVQIVRTNRDASVSEHVDGLTVRTVQFLVVRAENHRSTRFIHDP
jgi:hypothetical protein